MALNGHGPISKVMNRLLTVSKSSVEDVQPRVDTLIEEINTIIDIATNQSATETEFVTALYDHFNGKTPLEKITPDVQE
jgi:hypothetical protein